MPSGLVRRRLGVAVAVLGLLVLAAPAAADDDQPRHDILFSSDREAAGLSFLDIYAMRPDGTDIIRLTETAGFWNNGPDWSPNGEHISFFRCHFVAPPLIVECDIWVMNADGTGEAPLTTTPGALELFPTWSPDGKHVLFSRFTPAGGSDLFVMDADGSNVTNITNTPTVGETDPDWSPNGKEILYSSAPPGAPFVRCLTALICSQPTDIYRHNLKDGTSTNLTNSSTSVDWNPVWSTNGQKIAFSSTRASGTAYVDDVFVMDADGTDVQQLTASGSHDWGPTWSRNGQRIYFHSNRDLRTNCLTPLFGLCTQLYVMDADGENEDPVLVEDASIHQLDVYRG